MVPARYVVESFGGEVDFHSHPPLAVMNLRGRVAEVVPGSTQGIVNGKAELLEAPAAILDDTLFLPAPFLGRALALGYAFNESAQAIILMSRDGQMAGRRVIVDPGHGGSDPGARGPGGLSEKDVALDIAVRAGEMLSLGGVAVTLTRTDDSYRSLSQRVAASRDGQGDVFLSIHCNSYVAPSAHGTETYYYESWQGQKLAVALQQELIDELERSDLGVREAGFYVLRHTTMPAALAEVAFISNPEEEQLLGDTWFRARAALALFRGVRDYLEVLSNRRGA
jgi:N-acetylmuramoyl-L-alanine amidase